MPDIGRIQSTNFQSLLTELGITRNQIPFSLRSEVTPVVLVGGTVSFLAAPTPAYQVTQIFTAGPLVAPVAGVVLADTGQLPIGAYTVKFYSFAGESQVLQYQWRDAANAVNLWVQNVRVDSAELDSQFSARFNVLNDDERFRIVIRDTATAAIVYQSTIFAAI